MIKPDSPIGLFDSGVGGLTVTSAVCSTMPFEKIIYFGDTANLPYGDKSKDTIIQYSLKIASFLLKKGCKVILIACNSASSNAYDEVCDFVGKRALVMNVVDPVTTFVLNETQAQNIGVIGTKATILSQKYARDLSISNKKLKIASLATPLLVPMIEEGFIFDDVSNTVIKAYLSRKEFKDIDTLILGCTHYFIIKDQISRFFNYKINVIDSAKIVAERLYELLAENNLLNQKSIEADHEFLVSKSTENFGIIARRLFGDKLNLKKISLDS